MYTTPTSLDLTSTLTPLLDRNPKPDLTLALTLALTLTILLPCRQDPSTASTAGEGRPAKWGRTLSQTLTQTQPWLLVIAYGEGISHGCADLELGPEPDFEPDRSPPMWHRTRASHCACLVMRSLDWANIRVGLAIGLGLGIGYAMVQSSEYVFFTMAIWVRHIEAQLHHTGPGAPHGVTTRLGKRLCIGH